MTSLPGSSPADVPLRTANDNSDPEPLAPSLEDTYRTFAPTVLAYFRSHGMESAEDLVGEVFVDVAQRLAGFRGDTAALRRWVFTIARRRRVDEIRRRVVRRLVVVRDPPEQSTTDAPHGIDSDLVAALHNLTALQRDVVVLRFVVDLSTDDVARMLRRSPGAIKALQVRALNQLSGRLDGLRVAQSRLSPMRAEVSVTSTSR